MAISADRRFGSLSQDGDRASGAKTCRGPPVQYRLNARRRTYCLGSLPRFCQGSVKVLSRFRASKLSLRLQVGAGCAGAAALASASGPAVRPTGSGSSLDAVEGLRVGPHQRPVLLDPRQILSRPRGGLGVAHIAASAHGTPSAASCGSRSYGSGSEWRTWRRWSPTVWRCASGSGSKSAEEKGGGGGGGQPRRPCSRPTQTRFASP
jgi:hypothetical protein